MNCLCGCGEETPLASSSRSYRGIKKGEPLRFIPGHYKHGAQKRCACGCSRTVKFNQEYRPGHEGHTSVNRFWDRVSILNTDECWEWQAGKADGYGVLNWNGKVERAHRVSYMLFHDLDSLRKDQFICHSCDNPACVNPVHLWLGDQESNQADKIAKGRQFRPSSIFHKCSIEHCERRNAAHGLCDTHLARVKTHGTPLAHIPVRAIIGKKYSTAYLEQWSEEVDKWTK